MFISIMGWQQFDELDICALQHKVKNYFALHHIVPGEARCTKFGHVKLEKNRLAIGCTSLKVHFRQRPNLALICFGGDPPLLYEVQQWTL